MSASGTFIFAIHRTLRLSDQPSISRDESTRSRWWLCTDADSDFGPPESQLT